MVTMKGKNIAKGTRASCVLLFMSLWVKAVIFEWSTIMYVSLPDFLFSSNLVHPPICLFLPDKVCLLMSLARLEAIFPDVFLFTLVTGKFEVIFQK